LPAPCVPSEMDATGLFGISGDVDGAISPSGPEQAAAASRHANVGTSANRKPLIGWGTGRGPSMRRIGGESGVDLRGGASLHDNTTTNAAGVTFRTRSYYAACTSLRAGNRTDKPIAERFARVWSRPVAGKSVNARDCRPCRRDAKDPEVSDDREWRATWPTLREEASTGDMSKRV
jgi:hypothetical protein